MAAPTLDGARSLRSAAPGHDRFARRRIEAAIGSAASVALVLCLLALGANAASGRSSYVPSGAHRFPAWLAGPLAPLGFTTAHAVLEGLVIAICVCYALVLACLRSLQPRHVWAAVLAATIAALLTPPLLSTDVFGYLGFARLGVLHGLSPYSYTANAAPHDAVFPYLGWRTVTTPYGPAFTLFSYALVPLGLAGGLWAFKLLAAATTLATVALIWRIAERLGRSPRWAIAMYGLNPLVLVFAVGGAHNDTLFEVLLAAAALWMISGRERAGAVSVLGAIAVKVSAGLILPYAWIGARRHHAFAGEALAAAVVFGAISFAVFGTHLSGIEHALAAEQHQVARHGVPAELSGLLGLGRPDAQGVRLAEGVRVAFIVAFAAALAATLWRAWRGAWWLDCYAWATLALLACSAWLLPWYGMWALLPASVSASHRLQGVTLAACAYLVAIKIL
jgi:alpha-1,6-mannosyltransferase